MPKINTAEKKIRISAGAVGIFASFFVTKNLLKMSLVTMYSAPHLTGKAYEGSFGTTFVHFSMPTWIYECNQLTFKYDKIAK